MFTSPTHTSLDWAEKASVRAELMDQIPPSREVNQWFGKLLSRRK